MSGDVGTFFTGPNKDENAVRMLEGASAGADVVATYTRARATRGQALYNAAMAELEAEDTRNLGNTKAARRVSETDRATGRIKTQIAGRGFTTGVGTANDVQDASDFVGRLDALTIRQDTERKVMEKRAKATGYRGLADSISPGTEATGTLLGHASTLARRWSKE